MFTPCMPVVDRAVLKTDTLVSQTFLREGASAKQQVGARTGRYSELGNKFFLSGQIG
jgi:hypothetical protein